MNFIDIHCHPSMKINLFNRHIYDVAHPGGTGLEFSTNMFVNLPNMKTGGVNAAISVHHIPEIELQDDVKRRAIGNLLVDTLDGACGPYMSRRFQDISTPTAAFGQMKAIINKFEDDVEAATRMPHNFKAAVAKSLTEFNHLISNGYTVFLHSIEGAHCLGINSLDYNTVEPEIIALFNAGVCQFTLGHFFENVLVSSSGGIPPKIADLIDYNTGNNYPAGYNPATAQQAIAKMLDLGIIIDLVHTHSSAKQMIYTLNKNRGVDKRPLVFSHTGIQEIALKYNPKMPQQYYEYLPNATDIAEIRDCGGVLGIIFMDYWLEGNESTQAAIDIVIETIQFIAAKCGSKYDNIAIGSDLDGFTEVPRDLSGSDKMPALIDAMSRSGIQMSDIENICFNNYMRVLKNGWGKQ